MILEIEHEVNQYHTLKAVPANQQSNVRNDMYISSEALRLFAKSKKPTFTAEEAAVMANYKKKLDLATKFIPPWVKVAVAIALGLGTMIGWKRIVVTVGEKIGKTHLTYGQGASAEIVAMFTIWAADNYRVTGQYHPRPLLGRGRDHDGQQERAAVVNDPQYRSCLGLHLAGGGSHGSGPLLDLCSVCSQRLAEQNGQDEGASTDRGAFFLLKFPRNARAFP